MLGPLEVLHDGHSVELPGPRERMLLALLAVRAPGAVTPGQLLEDLWNGRPPPGARNTLRSYVSTLRRGLRVGGIEGGVCTRSAGYAIDPDAGWTVDSAVFSSLVEQAESQRLAGDREGQAETLASALRLWRGRPFEEVADVEAVVPEVRRLEEARVAAIESRAEAVLACGGHAGLAAELAALCEEHPLRERLWWLRMLALYRSGRQAEALDAYHDVRARLLDGLGIEPGAELRALESAILRHDPSLAGVPAAASPQMSVHPALRPQMPGAFVGRRAELDALEACRSVAVSGAGQIVAVSGEPGIGKTRLISEYAHSLTDKGVRVLYTRCSEDSARPYQPFAEALQQLSHDGLLAGPALIVLSSEERPQLSSLPPARNRDDERARLFDAVADHLAEAAAAHPTVLVLEDVHWADPSTLQLLSHVARRAAGAGLFLLPTYRTAELAAKPALASTMDGLTRDPGVTGVELDGLTEHEVATLVDDSLPGELELDRVGMARLLGRVTGGNPLFLRQMLAQLVVAPDSFLDSRDPAALPTGLRDVISRRLAALVPKTTEVLALAAVIGREFDLSLLEAAADDRADVLDAMDRAERARLLEELPGAPGRRQFTHDLIKQAVYERCGAARRMRLHERVGKALEAAASPSIVAMADHFAAAARPGHTGKAADYAVRAARQALDQLAFEEAAGLAERGLRCVAMESLPDAERVCELELVLAEARLFARDIAGCKEAAGRAGDAARRLRSPERLARAAVLAAYLNVFGDPDEVTPRLCEDALAALGNEPSAWRALVLAGFADHTASAGGDGPRGEKLSRQAVATARRSGNAAALERALFVHAEVLSWSARVDERAAIAEELLTLAMDRGSVRAEANAHYIRALARLESGDVAGFDADLARLDELRPRAGYWYLDMFAALWHGMRALLDGRLDEVEPLTDALLGHASHEPNVVNLYLGQLYCLRREQGRLAELRAPVLDAIEANPDVVGFRCALAVIHAELGELAEAAEQLDRLAANRFATLHRDATWAMSLSALADVAALVEDRARARTLANLLAPFSGRLIVPTKGIACIGAADRWLGRLVAVCGEAEKAEQLFDRALALETRAGCPSLVAVTNSYREHALARYP